RPGCAQRGAREGDPGRRPHLSGIRAYRPPGVAQALLRQLQDDRGGCALDPGRRQGPGRAAGQGSVVTSDLLPAERKVLERLGDLPLDFRAMAVISNLFRASIAIRRHMEANVLADDRLSWTSFVVLWVL